MKNKYLLLFSSLSILLFFVGFFLFIVLPNSLILNFSVLLIAIIFAFICIFIERKRILSYLNSMHWKNLSSACLSIFLVFCILGVINYIGVKKPFVYDFSKRKLNSLSEQSLKVLDNLVKEDVKLRIFSGKNNRPLIESFLKLYKNNSQFVSIDYVDPVLKPNLVQEYGIIQAPSIVVQRGEKFSVITDMRELEVTNGLIKVFRKTDPILCFHLNQKFSDASEIGYSALINFLKKSSFSLKVIDLLKVEKIPSSCSLYIAWALDRDLLPGEIKKIREYSAAGGKVMSSFSPMFKKDIYVGLREIFKENGLFVKNDIVIDKKNFMGGSKGTAPFISNFDSLKINNDKGQRVAFSLSNSILPTKGAEDNFLALALTSEDSWAEQNLLEVLADTVSYNVGDRVGPIAMAAANIINNKPRFIAFGSSGFVSNKFLSLSTNFTYLLNIIHWSVGEDMLTSLHTSMYKERPIYIGTIQKQFILFVCVIAMPILFLFFSIFIFKKRRV